MLSPLLTTYTDVSTLKDNAAIIPNDDLIIILIKTSTRKIIISRSIIDKLVYKK